MTNGECATCRAPVEDLGETLHGGLGVLEIDDWSMMATVGGQVVIGGRLGGNVFDLAGCPTCRIFSIVGGYIERHRPHEIPAATREAWARVDEKLAGWTYRHDLQSWTTYRDALPA